MTTNSKPSEARKPWQKPELRAASPARRTRGGAGAINDQDDTWYTLS